MIFQLNSKFIDAIKQCVSTEENVVSVLMDTLSLGKEAIYRRIRGDVPFTLEEVVKLSLKFDLSIDKIANTSEISTKSQWSVFEVDALYSSGKYQDQYSEILNEFLKMLDVMEHSKKANVRYAGVTMPYTFLWPFEKLMKLRHYKWVYLTQGVTPDFTFSKMEIPSDILNLQQEIQAKSRKVLRSLYILNRNVFQTLINDINYFYQRNLISEKELKQLKMELYDLISFWETITSTGCYDEGAEVSIYLSDIELDASYVHFESDESEVCANWVYFINMLNFYNANICQRQKNWIESLKRYSEHITQTGETLRFEFLKNQRRLVDEKLKIGL